MRSPTLSLATHTHDQPGGKVPEEAVIARFLNEQEGDRDGGKRNVVIDAHECANTRIRASPPEEAMRVMSSASGMERIIIHLELELGLRRVEVLRLTTRAIGLGYINVLGKGRMGGKPRRNPFNPDTNAELMYWFKLRDIEIEKARAKNPAVVVPDALLIYERAGKLYPYRRSAKDERIRAVSERTGLVLTNHTLRRTFDRTCWLAGVPLEKIKDLIGHEDTKTTIQYLCINMNDKAEAMDQLFKFQFALLKGKNEPSQAKWWTDRDLCPRRPSGSRKKCPEIGAMLKGNYPQLEIEAWAARGAGRRAHEGERSLGQFYDHQLHSQLFITHTPLFPPFYLTFLTLQ
jgi:hypothetical protein